MYVLHVIRSAVRYAAKGKTEVEEESGAGLNISVQLTVVDLGQLVRYLQCQCTMSRARLCPEGHLLNVLVTWALATWLLRYPYSVSL